MGITGIARAVMVLTVKGEHAAAGCCRICLGYNAVLTISGDCKRLPGLSLVLLAGSSRDLKHVNACAGIILWASSLEIIRRKYFEVGVVIANLAQCADITAIKPSLGAAALTFIPLFNIANCRRHLALGANHLLL